MSDSTPNPTETVEYYELRIPKATLKKIVLVASAAAVATGVVLLKKNLQITTTEDSITVEKADGVNGV